MDDKTTNWSEKRFNYIVENLKIFLKKTGYNPE